MCEAMWLWLFYKRGCSKFILRFKFHSASMEESFSKQDVRTIMKFLFLQGKRPPEIHRELEGVFKNNAASEQTVRKWFRLFQEGWTTANAQEDHRRSQVQRWSSKWNCCWPKIDDRPARSWQRGLTSRLEASTQFCTVIWTSRRNSASGCPDF